MKNSRFSVGVHILTLLQSAGGGPLSSEYIAGSVNTNPVVIRRLLGVLGRAGLVVSQAGAGGGSRLARAADSITLRDVYDAIEDPDLFALHEGPNPKCPVGRHINAALAAHLQTASRAMRAALDEVTIAAMVRSVATRAQRAS
jgi:Rrf2 family protein